MITAFIPAKSRSTRLPGKNFRPLCGKSLVQRAIEWCRQEPLIDSIVLATDARVDFEDVRRWSLTEEDLTEERSAFALMCDFARLQPPDMLLACIMATAPFRLHSEFRRAVQELKKGEYNFCVSVFDLHIPPAGDRSGVWRSQDREPMRFPAASWRIGAAGVFAQYQQNHPPVERVCWFSVHPVGMVDIDYPEDWELAEWIAPSWDQMQPQP